MAKFKIGDRVRVGPNPGTGPEPGSGYVDASKVGHVGTIIADDSSYGYEPDSCPLVSFGKMRDAIGEFEDTQFVHENHLRRV